MRQKCAHRTLQMPTTRTTTQYPAEPGPIGLRVAARQNGASRRSANRTTTTIGRRKGMEVGRSKSRVERLIPRCAHQCTPSRGCTPPTQFGGHGVPALCPLRRPRFALTLMAHQVDTAGWLTLLAIQLARPIQCSWPTACNSERCAWESWPLGHACLAVGRMARVAGRNAPHASGTRTPRTKPTDHEF